jgi:hypothetical protein
MIRATRKKRRRYSLKSAPWDFVRFDEERVRDFAIQYDFFGSLRQAGTDD